MFTLIKIQAKNLLTCAAAASTVLMITGQTMAVTPAQGDPTNLPTTFESMATPVAMNHISHFEFLYCKEVSKKISLLLCDEAVSTEEQAPLDSADSTESSDPQDQVWRQIAGDE